MKKIKLYEPAIGKEEIENMAEAAKSGYLTNNPNGWVRRFEDMTKEYLGVKHAIAVSSGTAAIQLALEVVRADYCFSSAFSFPAVKHAVLVLDGILNTKDIDSQTYNMKIGDYEADFADEDWYDCIIPIHLFGQSVDMDSVAQYVYESKRVGSVSVVEDAACALGAKYKGRFCGTMGDVGCFSFHPRKVITTGEGGMLVTDSEELAKKAILLRNHGIDPEKKEDLFHGYNFRMSEIAGAMGCAQMKKLDRLIERRRQIAAVYNDCFYLNENLVIPPIQAEGCFHIYQSYVVRIAMISESSTGNALYRNGIIKKLKEKGIDCAIGSYCLDLDKEEARKAAAQTIALPIHTKMSPDDAIYVAETLLEVL